LRKLTLQEEVKREVMSDASDFLKKWVRKNVTPTTAHVRDELYSALSVFSV
jgi:hypothetical protein